MDPFRSHQQDYFQDVFDEDSASDASLHSDYLWMAPGAPPQGTRGVPWPPRRYSDPLRRRVLDQWTSLGDIAASGSLSSFESQGYRAHPPYINPPAYRDEEAILLPRQYQAPIDPIRLPSYSETSLAPPDIHGRPGIINTTRLGGMRHAHAAGELERFTEMGVQFEEDVDFAPDSPFPPDSPTRRFRNLLRRPQYGREDSREWSGRMTAERDEREQRGVLGRFSPTTLRRPRMPQLFRRTDERYNPADFPTFRSRMQERMRRWSSSASRGW